MGADQLETTLRDLANEVRESALAVARLETEFKRVPEFAEKLDEIERDFRKHETEAAGIHAGLQSTVNRLAWAAGVFITSMVGVAIAALSRGTP